MNTKQQMLRSSVVVVFFNLLGGLSGILVETSIAANLGLSMRSDTFYMAYTIPYIITNLITATGQFSLVPFFSSLESSRNEDDVWHGFSYVANILVLGLGAITMVGVVASPLIVHGIAPGFTHQQHEVATQLSRWLFLILVPAGIGEAQRSFLLSRHYFALSTASGFIRNVVSIVIIVVGFHRYGPQSIFMGYLTGYFVQMVILGIPMMTSFRPRYFGVFHAQGESFSHLRGAGTAQLGSALAWQGVVIVERIIASFLPPGTLTALNYGFKILGTLCELLGGSVGTASLPALSRAFAAQNHDEAHRTFRDTMELSLLFLSPMAVFCLMLDRSIIRLVFQRGMFTTDATQLMSMIFFYYSLSLFSFTFIRLLNTYLFARREPGTYFRLSLLHYSLVLVFDLFYVGVLRWGAKGIPLGFLTGATIAGGLAIRRNLGEVRASLDPALGRFAGKVVVGVSVTALSVAALRAWMTSPLTTPGNFVYLCMICGTGSLLYLGVLAALRALPISQLAALWPRTNGA